MALVFYDTETTGLHTSFDQILQFAAVLTDANFKEIDRFEIRCRLLPHIVPSPKAIHINQISVARLTERSLSTHYEMVCQIREKLLAWCPANFVGYNSISFDEHLIRQALYQCLHSPYLTNAPGNARADVMRILQFASVVAPNSFAIPLNDDGKPSFKLARIAPANGYSHTRAHDAIGDAEATLYLARLISERTPEVWSSAMRFSQKAAVIDFVTSEPMFLLTDNYFGVSYSWLVTYLEKNPENSSELYVYDLAIDPNELGGLNDDALLARMTVSPKPVRRLRANAAPNLLPAADAPATAFIGCIRMEELDRRASMLAADQELRARIVAAFKRSRGEKEASVHLEEQIYDDFTSDEDARILAEFHGAPWETRAAILTRLKDVRLRKLGRRLIYLERPDVLDAKTRNEFERAVARRVTVRDDSVPWLTLPKAILELDSMMAEVEDPGGQLSELAVHLDYWKSKATSLLAADPEPKAPALSTD